MLAKTDICNSAPCKSQPSNTYLYTAITTSMLLLALLFTHQAHAIGKIIAQSEAAEADEIIIEFEDNKTIGVAQVMGCPKCPLELQINNRTGFYNNGEALEREQIRQLSGRSGTVIYDGDSKRVIRIRW